MIAGVKAVNTSRADLGIVVDTDVDRSAVVAGNGTPINSNRYIALMSYITLRCGLTGDGATLDMSPRSSCACHAVSELPWGTPGHDFGAKSHGRVLIEWSESTWGAQLGCGSCSCRKYPGTTIVTDSVTSNGLTDFIEGLGGKHFRYRRGYKNVIGKGVELNGQGVPTELMMETRHAPLCT